MGHPTMQENDTAKLTPTGLMTHQPYSKYVYTQKRQLDSIPLECF